MRFASRSPRPSDSRAAARTSNRFGSSAKTWRNGTSPQASASSKPSAPPRPHLRDGLAEAGCLQELHGSDQRADASVGRRHGVRPAHHSVMTDARVSDVRVARSIAMTKATSRPGAGGTGIRRRRGMVGIWGGLDTVLGGSWIGTGTGGPVKRRTALWIHRRPLQRSGPGMPRRVSTKPRSGCASRRDGHHRRSGIPTRPIFLIVGPVEELFAFGRLRFRCHAQRLPRDGR